jgi:DNA-directed RNA polymerase subunit RPC12/RpoP
MGQVPEGLRVSSLVADLDYRCPNCGKDLAKRKLALSIIAKMEIDCPGCMQRLSMNIHQVESAATLLFSLGFVGMLLVGILRERHEVIGIGIVIGLLGGVASFLVERVYLREWPRYLLKDAASPQ